MSSGHSVLITGASFAIGIYANCLASRDSDTPAPLGRPLVVGGTIRLEERARIVRELHDTVRQGFLGASKLLHRAIEQTPADPLPSPR